MIFVYRYHYTREWAWMSVCGLYIRFEIASWILCAKYENIFRKSNMKNVYVIRITIWRTKFPITKYAYTLYIFQFNFIAVKIKGWVSIRLFFISIIIENVKCVTCSGPKMVVTALQLHGKGDDTDNSCSVIPLQWMWNIERHNQLN